MIKLFSEIGERDRNLAGGKAYHQAYLWQKGFNAPPGLIITAATFEAFLRAHQLNEKLAALDDHPGEAEQLHNQIEAANLPADLAALLKEKFSLAFPDDYPYGFAVRSSALDEDSSAHSFAGIHRTLLAIARGDVARAIIACWASALSPQAIEYRRENHLSLAHISIAVLIQPMLMPSSAGVAFTVDPITNNRDEMLINATYGLGEMLVSGYVTPDSLRLRKGNPPALISQQLGAKATELIWQNGALKRLPVSSERRQQFALSAAQQENLARELQRIESTFGAPQDVEWAYQDDRLFILQSRPVTTVASLANEEIIWSRMNLREVVPELPSPFMNGIMELSEPEFVSYYENIGLKKSIVRPITKIIYGRPYFNLTTMKLMLEALGLPSDTMLRMMGHGEEFQGAIDYRINYRKMLTSPGIVIRSIINQRRTTPTIKQAIEQADAELAAYRSFDVDNASFAQIAKLFDSRRPYFTKFIHQSGSIAGNISSKFLTILRLLGDTMPTPESFINTQIAIGEKNFSSQMGLDLLLLGETARNDELCRQYFTSERNNFSDYANALAGTQFLKQFQDFLARYGHRAIYESDPARPRYHEDPSYLLFTISNMATAQQFVTAAQMCRQQEEQAAQEWQQLEKNLRARSIFAPIKLAMIRSQLKALKKLFALRERARAECMRVIDYLRSRHLRMAARLTREGYLASTDDFYYLEPARLVEILTNGNMSALQTLATQNRARYAFYEKLALPNLLRESEIASITKPELSAPADGRARFHGLAVSPGLIEAEVIVLKSPAEFARMQPGKILVAPATDPAWTPLFTLAVGVIVEIGGMLSHGSIVAREYGLPTVVNIPGITRRLRDGDRVMIDGAAGIVEVLSSNKNGG